MPGMNFFTHPDARYVFGKALGLPWLERLSLLTLKDAQGLDWHTHEEFELICCMKGLLCYELEGLPRLTVPPGCFIFIPPLQRHCLQGGVDGPCVRLSLFLRKSAARLKASPVSVFRPREYARLIRLTRHSPGRPLSFSKEAAHALARIVQLIEQNDRPSCSDLLELRVLSAYAFHLMAVHHPAVPWQPGHVRLMDDAVNWLKLHYAEAVTLAQLTAYMGYGHSRFAQLFRSHTGRTPMDWLAEYRVSRACELLSKGDLTIRQVAAAVGFTDPGFFTRTFRHRTGQTPTDFQKGARPRRDLQ